jgi:Fe(3+) dicitrate transport protein
VQVAGVELSGSYRHSLAGNLWMPLSLVYTYTETAFQATFLSNFSQWSPGYFKDLRLPVRQGDELPYTPEHQGRLQVGLAGPRWSADLAIRFVSEMREVPRT